ncbi:MAG: ABC transporter substrate-binding protein, partial [Armatimonadota bacterium]|nr:ABC transporter substrate-binding protein [Armatimonadota bacterium]
MLRRLRWSGVILAVLVTWGLAGGFPAQSQTREPIRIGLIFPITGGFAANGRDSVNGFQMFWEEKGNAVAGRRVEIVVEDDVNVPANSLTKARKLVEQDRVHLLVGPLSAASGLALVDYVNSGRVPTVYPIVSADDITQRRRSPYIVRLGWTSSQVNHPFGDWV